MTNPPDLFHSWQSVLDTKQTHSLSNFLTHNKEKNKTMKEKKSLFSSSLYWVYEWRYNNKEEFVCAFIKTM